MSVSNKIKAAMQLQGISRIQLAESLGTTPNSLNVKFNRGAFSVDDLIRTAAALGLSVVLSDSAGCNVITFTPEDAAPPRRSGTKTE